MHARLFSASGMLPSAVLVLSARGKWPSHSTSACTACACYKTMVLVESSPVTRLLCHWGGLLYLFFSVSRGSSRLRLATSGCAVCGFSRRRGLGLREVRLWLWDLRLGLRERFGGERDLPRPRDRRLVGPGLREREARLRGLLSRVRP